jgi:hypothetical protein
MLNKGSLKDKIISELEAQGFDTGANGRDGGGWMPKFAQAVANAVIDEITQNARATGTDSGAFGGDSHELNIE